MELTNGSDIGIQLLSSILTGFDRHGEVHGSLNCGPLSRLDTPGIETNVLAESSVGL